MQDWQGSFMFGNNNCPMNVIDIRMGPIKPGTKLVETKKTVKEGGVPNGLRTGNNTTQKEAKKPSNDAEPEAASVVDDGTEEDPESSAAKNLSDSASIRTITLTDEEKLQLKLDHEKMVKEAQHINKQGIKNLSDFERKAIVKLLGTSSGMFPFLGVTSRLPIEMWFLTEKCLEPVSV